MKHDFRIACAIAGISMAKFAKEQGVTRQTLCQVLSGKKKSERLTIAAKKFIQRHIPKFKQVA
ncbi:MAG TPA: hypothetical protein VHO70_19870 [Chitinispirillaceae bacterium]|nr:hypothetical protein [Chitinispirillaceae bacterium]